MANFFSGNPNSQQAVYIAAQRDIQDAARRSALVADAQRNTTAMLDGMLGSLGFKHVTVDFAAADRQPQAARLSGHPPQAHRGARCG